MNEDEMSREVEKQLKLWQKLKFESESHHDGRPKCIDVEDNDPLLKRLREIHGKLK